MNSSGPSLEKLMIFRIVKGRAIEDDNFQLLDDLNKSETEKLTNSSGSMTSWPLFMAIALMS